MKKGLGLLLVSGSILLLLNLCYSQPDKKAVADATAADTTMSSKQAAVVPAVPAAAAPVAQKSSKMAPNFTLIDLHDDTITLSSYRGKQPVLLFFWTTWCPFCQNELRALNDRYGGLIQDGLEVLGVDVGETYDKVNSFASSYYLAFRVLLDKDTSASKAYNLAGVPTYVLVNKDGDIVFKDNFFPSAYKDLLGMNKK